MKASSSPECSVPFLASWSQLPALLLLGHAHLSPRKNLYPWPSKGIHKRASSSQDQGFSTVKSCSSGKTVCSRYPANSGHHIDLSQVYLRATAKSLKSPRGYSFLPADIFWTSWLQTVTFAPRPQLFAHPFPTIQRLFLHLKAGVMGERP